MYHKDNDLVLLGEVLCTYEEYIPSSWTYVEDGNIKASITGRIKIDDDEKTISISFFPTLNLTGSSIPFKLSFIPLFDSTNNGAETLINLSIFDNLCSK